MTLKTKTYTLTRKGAGGYVTDRLVDALIPLRGSIADPSAFSCRVVGAALEVTVSMDDDPGRVSHLELILTPFQETDPEYPTEQVIEELAIAGEKLYLITTYDGT